MKRLSFTIYLLALFFYCLAIPSTRKPFSVKQSDGTELTLVLEGDEVFHYLATLDGIPVVESNGSYYYATGNDGKLTSTIVLAHNPESRTDSEKDIVSSITEGTNEIICTTWSARLRNRNIARSRNHGGANESRARGTFGYPSSYIGEKNGIVILVQFPDLKFCQDNTPEEYNNIFNQHNYNKYNFAGSVRDYFYEQSYGQLDINFDIIGPVTVSKSYSYYGSNNSTGNDKHCCELTTEVCQMISDDCDFLKYDWNGDNEVEQIFIIYAGPGEHTNAGSNYIWPHEWTLKEGQEELGDGPGITVINGATINTYAMSCELPSNLSIPTNGIGTSCHEFSHCLGIPDLYCTNNSSHAFGMSYWDCLAIGSVNGPAHLGEAPCGYSAYERWFSGWLEPIELDSPCDIINMPCIADAPIAYIIYNDANRNEFFMIENRQPTNKWFQYTYYHTGFSGMLLYHVDYDETAWKENQVNITYSHERMTVVPADNSYGRVSGNNYYSSKDELAGDLFPGSLGVTEFKDGSHTYYGGKLFNKNTDGSYNLHKSITNIKEENGLLSFSFMGGGKIIDCNNINNFATENSEAEYYSLSGIKTNDAPTTKGVYIMRQNGITKKIIR